MFSSVSSSCLLADPSTQGSPVGLREGGGPKEGQNVNEQTEPQPWALSTCGNKSQEAAQLPKSHLSTDCMEHLPASGCPARLAGEGARQDVYRRKFYIRALIRDSEGRKTSSQAEEHPFLATNFQGSSFLMCTQSALHTGHEHLFLK